MKMLGEIFLGLSLLFIPVVPAISAAGRQPDSDPDGDYPGEPGTYQVIISEIMADPYPPAGLPDAEYIELYNRGGSAVSLAGCRMILGNRQRTLPSVILEPQAYAVVCEAADTGLFTVPVKTIPLEKMPSILNQGMVITLRSPSGRVIHTVEFLDRWYRSPDKTKGGWSLEIIDPDNCCGRAENWRESIDPRGGTPGSRNAVYAKNPDRIRPRLLRATLNADSTVMLHFSESMDSASLAALSQYTADHGLLQPVGIDPVDPAYRSANLTFGSRLDQTTIYTVTALHYLHDCAGNHLDNNARADFAIPQEADSLDVVFNEILFDVPGGTSEFIELLNRRGKTIDLARFSVALSDPRSDAIARQVSLVTNPFLLLPGHCTAITRDAGHLPDSRGHLDLSNIAEYPYLFTLPDEEGEIALILDSVKVIDRFRYSRSMHSEFLSETEGISLERIRADEPSNNMDNWHSAASVAGFSTPGLANSQELTPTLETREINIAPAVFSPDGDGRDDAMILSMIPGASGFVSNVMIFDSRGTKVRTLAANVLVGTETIMDWDGRGDDQNMRDPGIYIIYIELFNTSGIVKKFRKVVTLVRNQ